MNKESNLAYKKWYGPNMISICQNYLNFSLQIITSILLRIFILYFILMLFMPIFFMEKTQLPKTTKQTIKTNVWSVIKWGEKNELFPLKLTFSQNNLANFYFSSSKQILILVTTWKRQRYTSFWFNIEFFDSFLSILDLLGEKEICICGTNCFLAYSSELHTLIGIHPFKSLPILIFVIAFLLMSNDNWCVLWRYCMT